MEAGSVLTGATFDERLKSILSNLRALGLASALPWTLERLARALRR